MKIIFGALSIVFLGMAFVGLAVPVLPATPFIFLSVFFAMRSSEKLTNYIKSLNIYKEHLEPFANDRVMTKSSKVRILFIATSMMMIPIITVPNIYLRIFLIGLIVTQHVYFIFFIKTVEASQLRDSK